MYFIVRNSTVPIQVRHENGTLYWYEYFPLSIASLGNKGDLDQGLTINLGDLGEHLPMQIDNVAKYNSFHVKPTVTYRTYRSDDLDHVLYGPLFLEITSLSFTKEGCAFDAKAPSLNINTTGELYSIDRFSTLRGFL
jgi:hypothetical protein